MNAVISGRAGLALVLDCDRAFALTAFATGEPTPCGPLAGMRLFGDARDLEFIEDTNLAEVKEQLDEAANGDTALHLTLILLDPELSVETRQEAATEVEELVSTAAADRLRNVMYAAPPSSDSDHRGAASICDLAGTDQTRAFLHDLVSVQQSIRAVSAGWDALDSSLFPDDEGRNHARAVAVRAGLFRRYVQAHSSDESLEAVLLDALASRTFRLVKNHKAIAQKWVVRHAHEVPEFPEAFKGAAGRPTTV